MLRWYKCKPTTPDGPSWMAIRDSFRYATDKRVRLWLYNKWQSVIIDDLGFSPEGIAMLEYLSNRASRKVQHPNLGIKRSRFSYKKFRRVLDNSL